MTTKKTPGRKTVTIGEPSERFSVSISLSGYEALKKKAAKFKNEKGKPMSLSAYVRKIVERDLRRK